MITYYFSCGCVLKEDDLRRKGNRVYCAVHKTAKLLYRESKCVDCDTLVRATHGGRISQRCPVCKKRHVQEYQKAWKKGQTTKQLKAVDTEIINSALAPPRNYDCKFYNECLEPKTGRLMLNPRACQKCKKYEPEQLNVMDYVESGENLVYFGEKGAGQWKRTIM